MVQLDSLYGLVCAPLPFPLVRAPILTPTHPPTPATLLLSSSISSIKPIIYTFWPILYQSAIDCHRTTTESRQIRLSGDQTLIQDCTVHQAPFSTSTTPNTYSGKNQDGEFLLVADSVPNALTLMYSGYRHCPPPRQEGQPNSPEERGSLSPPPRQSVYSALPIYIARLTHICSSTDS